MKKIIIIFLLLSVGLSQVTLTEEESKNITNNIIELQTQVDSLTIDTNLKAEEIDLLNKKVTLLEEDLSMTEKKAKLVKASWYENKWLYFGYGGVLSYALISALNALDNIF
jgi:peptidoglycan hydrolase CwlO-like protein